MFPNSLSVIILYFYLPRGFYAFSIFRVRFNVGMNEFIVVNEVVYLFVYFHALQDIGENLDPSLNPILSKNTIQRGTQSVILIGEAEIEYNSNFRLYMTTPLANPHFLPEVCIKVTVINFTVTQDGLQDQLLSRVVQKEKPKLEESRRELLQSLVTDRYKLRELEDRSLSLLHSSSGNNYVFITLL